jgi:hypothetical protein
LFNKKEKISTVYGKGLTYVYIFICGVFLILTGLLCWNSDNFKITILNKNTIEITDTSDKRINTIFKFSILPNFAQGTKFLLFNTTTSQYQEFQYRNCTDEDFLYFSQSNNSSFINYCVELKDIIDNIYLETSNIEVELFFVECEKLYSLKMDNSTCIHYPPIVKGQHYYFALEYISYNYDFYNLFSPKKAVTNLLSNSPKNNEEERFFFVVKAFHQHFYDDINLIINNYSNDYSLITNKFQIYYLELNSRGHLCGAYIRLDTTYREVYRGISKFPQFLSIFFVFSKIFYFICVIFYSLFDNFYYLKFLVNILNKKEKIEDDNKSSYIKLKVSRIVPRENFLNAKENVLLNFKILKFSEYLKFLISKKLKKDSILKQVENCLSFENIFLNLKNQETKNDHLLDFDFFTNKESYFSIKSQETFKTKVGGMISIIFILGIFPLIYLIGKDFLFKYNPSIHILTLNSNDIKTIKDKNYSFIFNTPFVFYYSYNLSGKMRQFQFMNKPGSFQELDCTYHSFLTTNISLADVRYTCSNVNTILTGNLLEGNGMILQKLWVSPCDPLDLTCLSENDLFKVGFAINYTLFNQNSYNNYMEKRIFIHQEEQKIINFPYYVISFKQNLLQDDKNIFFSSYSEEYFTSTIRRNILRNTPPAPRGAIQFSFSLNPGLTVITRVFKKLPEVLMEIISIVFLWKAFLSILSNLYNDYKYQKYLLLLSCRVKHLGSNIELTKLGQKSIEPKIENNVGLTSGYIEKEFNFSFYIFKAFYHLFKRNSVKYSKFENAIRKCKESISLEHIVHKINQNMNDNISTTNPKIKEEKPIQSLFTNN